MYFRGCALLPPAPFVNLQIYELVPAELQKSVNKKIAKQKKHLMKCVSFLVPFCHCVGAFFSHFFRIWASLRWWREARVWTKCKKEEKQSKKESQNDTLLIRNLCFFQLFFYWFFGQSWEVFFSALVAEVSQMRATWGHFSSHVAATLESWKLWFRLHQTLLFRVLRGWVKTFWPNFFQVFFWEGFGDVILRFLRIWGSSRTSKDDFWWAFQVQVWRFVFYEFSTETKFKVGQGDTAITRFLEP